MSRRPLLVLSWVLVGLGCSSDGPYGGNPPPPPPPPPPSPGPNAVNVQDNLFNPVTLNANSGATVTWTWRGSDLHNVTFEDGQSSSSNKITGTHQRGFSAAGTFRYRCTLHSTGFASNDGMVGSVVVQ